ncbi:MAG: S-layer homology domain-containing protein [Oscillospiraceae bacterium]|nr:S-layer homology domain-containing protein [Oscillospiraceae bacterium]
MKKRIWCTAAALAVAVVVAAAVGKRAAAAETADGLVYEVFSEYYYNYVDITGYTGSSKNVIIPAEIEGVPVQYVDLRDLGLTKIDVSQTTELRGLFCELNDLTTLDVSKNTELVTLWCGGNRLTNIDVSNNPLLEIVSVTSNQITNLSFVNNPLLRFLQCRNNQLSSLDVSQNPALEDLDCRENKLFELNVLNNPKLQDLNCEDNRLTILDVSQNPDLVSLYAGGNFLTPETVIGVDGRAVGTYISSCRTHGQRPLTFPDVPADAWFAKAVEFALLNFLFSGTSDTTFSPYDPMTRGMLSTVLWRLADSPSGFAPADFSDVSSGDYYAVPISWAQANNIVAGYPDGTFRPDDNITREQIAAILYKYARLLGKTGGDLPQLAFGDGADISDYAVTAVRWCVSVGIISGFPDNTFRPQNNATRAEVATMMRAFAGVVR